MDQSNWQPFKLPDFEPWNFIRNGRQTKAVNAGQYSEQFCEDDKLFSLDLICDKPFTAKAIRHSNLFKSQQNVNTRTLKIKYR